MIPFGAKVCERAIAFASWPGGGQRPRSKRRPPGALTPRSFEHPGGSHRAERRRPHSQAPHESGGCFAASPICDNVLYL